MFAVEKMSRGGERAAVMGLGGGGEDHWQSGGEVRKVGSDD